MVASSCVYTSLHNRWLTPTAQQQLNHAITEAEQGHRGEVVLVIENHLPISSARLQNSRDRAIEVFGDYRVWDTQDNTGVLVYLNICERRLEIVADRGINSHVMPTMWQAMCDKLSKVLKPIDTSIAWLHYWAMWGNCFVNITN
ncbi:MAG: TPM domain-containing protein [Moraxella sp.]